MRNIIYCAQFHDKIGYSVAAMGYLKSLDSVLTEEHNINLKIYSISLTENRSSFDESHFTDEERSLINKYHIKGNSELETLVSEGYELIWHTTTVLPIISKSRNVFFSKNCDYHIYDLIKQSSKNYHMLVWETSEIPSEWKELIEHFQPESLLTASEWNKDTFLKYTSEDLQNKDIGVSLVPHLIEETETSSNNFTGISNIDLKDKFVVFSLSEWNDRKNHHALITAFISELGNRDDAVLILKTSGAPKETITNEIKAVKNLVRVPHKKNNIILFLDYLKGEELNYLYNRCDIFALLSKGEGFSLPLSEATKFKKPVIAPKEGGHIDFLDKKSPLLVDGYWETVLGPAPYDIDGEWYIPTIKSAREKLCYAYDLWKSKPEKLKEIGKSNYQFMKNKNFDRENIGNVFIESLNGKTSFSLPKKEKIYNLKTNVKTKKTLEEKLSVLKNSFSGEECYILNCGPSLNQYDFKKLNKFLSDKLVFSVKNAINHSEIDTNITDFHFFNCSNLPIKRSHSVKNNWAIESPHMTRHYLYNDKETISIASSNYNLGHRWSIFQDHDMFFKVPIRTEINNEFLVRTGQIEENLLSNKISRPCGPGIMYETVLFSAIHLGVNKIRVLGWDLGNDKANESDYEHFYNKDIPLINKGDVLNWELKETREFSKQFYYWLLDNNIKLELLSNQSSLYEGIPRIDLTKEI